MISDISHPSIFWMIIGGHTKTAHLGLYLQIAESCSKKTPNVGISFVIWLLFCVNHVGDVTHDISEIRNYSFYANTKKFLRCGDKNGVYMIFELH